MDNWLGRLKRDPVPVLLAARDEALSYFVRRDILGDAFHSPSTLWELPVPARILRKQCRDGSWNYPGGNPTTTPGCNYSVLETYRNLRVLVEMYGFDRTHPALQAAATYIFSCQTEEGDIRGVLGNQYMPYYHGAILELLVKAGYDADSRVTRGLEWLLSMRQYDGAWIVPMQAVPSKLRAREVWQGPPVPPDRAKPSSHLATGMVLRAFAAHPTYSNHPGAVEAAAWLKERLFLADRYNDRKGPEYWLKFQYPFWWPSLLTALDTFSRLGVPGDDPAVGRGISWLVDNQASDGLWEHGYGAGKSAYTNRTWVGLAVCRVLRHYGYLQTS